MGLEDSAHPTRALRRRSGFTLLEVLLASAIAVLLLGAVYAALSITLRQTQDARDGVEVDHAARSVFNRMTLDLGSALGPLPPKSGGNAAAGTDSAPAAAATTGTGTTTGATTTDPTMMGTTSTDPTMSGAATNSVTAAGTQVPFQGGVYGSDTHLTVFVSRSPGVLTDPNFLNGTSPTVGTQVSSDLVRVTYWKSDGGALCRQERPWVTSDGVWDSTDPDKTTEATDVILENVTSLQFEYFDGAGNWVSSWTGSDPGPDGVTPQGPPRAVRVTLTLEIPSTRAGGQSFTKTVIQVVPVRASPGPNTPALLDANTDPESTGSGTTGTGTTGTGTGTGTTGSGTGTTGGTTTTGSGR